LHTTKKRWLKYSCNFGNRYIIIYDYIFPDILLENFNEVNPKLTGFLLLEIFSQGESAMLKGVESNCKGLSDSFTEDLNITITFRQKTHLVIFEQFG
jgi:hypothetical protein